MSTNATGGVPAKPNAGAVATVKNSDIVNSVLSKVHQFQSAGELKVPTGYVPENALKSAYLILQETTDSDGKSVLESCSPASIANALLNMVVQGLSPMKKQCSFIAYKQRLSMQREYAGTVALAKRFGGVKDVKANVIYKDDDFAYEKTETGRTKVTKHIQSIDNINVNQIKGAYATLIFEDGSTDTEVMTFDQIKQAWQQGGAKGNSPAHRNFPDQMAMKTVINRACKLHISTSDDSGVFDEEESAPDFRVVESQREIAENANTKVLTIAANEDPKPEAATQVAEPVAASENGQVKAQF